MTIRVLAVKHISFNLGKTGESGELWLEKYEFSEDLWLSVMSAYSEKCLGGIYIISPPFFFYKGHGKGMYSCDEEE